MSPLNLMKLTTHDVLLTIHDAFSNLTKRIKFIIPEDKKVKPHAELYFANTVGWTGFEPATSCTPYKRATGLRYHPYFCR